MRDRRQRRRAPQRVDHQVGAAVRERRRGRPPRDRRRPRATTASAPSAPRPLQPLGVAAGRHDAARAQQPRRLHRHRARRCRSPRARAPDRPALQPAALRDREPAGQAGDAERRGGDRVGVAGGAPTAPTSSATNRSASEPLAVFSVCHARARREARCPPARGRRPRGRRRTAAADGRRRSARGDRQVDRVQPRPRRLDQRLALAAHRLVALLDHAASRPARGRPPRASVGHPAAVDQQVRPAHVAALVRGQEHRRRGDVVGPAQPRRTACARASTRAPRASRARRPGGSGSCPVRSR